MSNDKQQQTKDKQSRARLDLIRELGYQPRAQGPVNLADLKPPRGGSAIEPPKRPVANDSK
jgi:hypothetical protein